LEKVFISSKQTDNYKNITVCLNNYKSFINKGIMEENMKEWNEKAAIKYLESQGIAFNNKNIVVASGFTGLTSCSARDYLVNHCGYRQV